ncbi:hypothetical protein [Xylanimonas protaetiae]|uniref:Nuclear transport factor 2 family protein n=1 Tax=Xylanimonas protaetiae TaxID=2509457 RepID=A0A4P6FBH7_9MICO|nr:hypothetical protein [Xylanimonas protaetiae]QAY70827.1 hypothetical protein ET471_13010 [Xylanimonas protaetiae]
MGATTAYDREDLLAFFVGYGLALGAGDLEGIAARVAFPALLVGADGSLPAPDAGTVHAALRPRLEAHRARDVVAAVPQVEDADALSDALVWAQVRWSYRDQYAGEQAVERVRYLLRREHDGFEICVLVPLPG